MRTLLVSEDIDIRRYKLQDVKRKGKHLKHALFKRMSTAHDLFFSKNRLPGKPFFQSPFLQRGKYKTQI